MFTYLFLCVVPLKYGKVLVCLNNYGMIGFRAMNNAKFDKNFDCSQPVIAQKFSNLFLTTATIVNKKKLGPPDKCPYTIFFCPCTHSSP